MSEDDNDFICKRTLERGYDGKEYQGSCKECCLHCSKKKTCEIACILVESDLKECSECISKKGYMAGEIFGSK